MKCPKCNFVNLPNARFCSNCATTLSNSDEISPPKRDISRTSIKELVIGSTFAGRYQVIEKVGEGGMGRVYRVLDKEIEEEVALKLIKHEIAADEKVIERFRNELKFARKISHRNVCRMYDISEDKGTHYITMEYVPGEELKEMIKRSGKLDIAKSISICSQVCEGLAEAHKLGVVHRDLKPQNIIIDNEGHARIMDFGIARSLEAGTGLTTTELMIGTPAYMSPEQLEAKEIDQRSDIYSLGVIFYEMVTGSLPFEGWTPISIALKKVLEKPRKPGKLNTRISKSLSRLILKCLEKDKKKRYKGAEELLSDLRKINRKVDKKPAGPVLKILMITMSIILTGVLFFLGIDYFKKSIENRAWKTAQKTNVIESYKRYLLDYPDGKYNDLARGKINSLKKKQFPFLYAIESRANEIHKNEKGYWEAVLYNETVMIYVHEGEFIMGSNDGDFDEKPVHNIYLDGYWIGKYEVTFNQYDRFCEDKDINKPDDEGWGRGNLPVINVSWNDALEYTKWISGKTGLTFRLPTEAEWEKAGRGTDGRKYPWGNPPLNSNLAYYNEEQMRTKSVGFYPSGSSPFGLLDTAGNVWEWCLDWYSDIFYTQSPFRNPEGPSSGTKRAVRGGCWIDNLEDLRCSNRNSASPIARNSAIGFRICLGIKKEISSFN